MEINAMKAKSCQMSIREVMRKNSSSYLRLKVELDGREIVIRLPISINIKSNLTVLDPILEVLDGRQ